MIGQKYTCFHESYIVTAPKILQFVVRGLAKCDTGIVCDWRVEIDARKYCGQRVDCVGPNSPDCPDPESVRYNNF